MAQRPSAKRRRILWPTLANERQPIATDGLLATFDYSYAATARRFWFALLLVVAFCDI